MGLYDYEHTMII